MPVSSAKHSGDWRAGAETQDRPGVGYRAIQSPRTADPSPYPRADESVFNDITSVSGRVGEAMNP